jgi:hypothetical protein
VADRIKATYQPKHHPGFVSEDASHRDAQCRSPVCCPDAVNGGGALAGGAMQARLLAPLDVSTMDCGRRKQRRLEREVTFLKTGYRRLCRGSMIGPHRYD